MAHQHQQLQLELVLEQTLQFKLQLVLQQSILLLVLSLDEVEIIKEDIVFKVPKKLN